MVYHEKKYYGWKSLARTRSTSRGGLRVSQSSRVRIVDDHPFLGGRRRHPHVYPSPSHPAFAATRLRAADLPGAKEIHHQ
jgi:hypothetical protein